MLPYIQVLGHQIPMYGPCIMAGIGLGVLVAVFRAGIFQYKKEDVLFAAIYGILGLIVGGKLLFLLTNINGIIQNFREIIGNKEYMLALMQGGFVFYGGFLGAVAGIVIYARQYRLSAAVLIEIIIPAVPLVHALGRIGCFCAGCCYGIPMEPPLGVYFHPAGAAPSHVALFPVQLLEAGCNLVLFGIMAYRYRNRQTGGEAFCFYLMAYGVLRFLLEFIRYDAERGFLLGMSTSQWISIILVLFAVYLGMKCKKRTIEK